MFFEVCRYILVPILCSLMASTGILVYVLKHYQAKNELETAHDKMLEGLGHDRIMSLGIKYIDQGCLSPDEYENLNKYLYTPYKNMGGNGSAKHIMESVNKLPIKSMGSDGWRKIQYGEKTEEHYYD